MKTLNGTSLLLLFFLFSCKIKSVKEVKQSDKPNIIFLLTDDQRWDALSYAGNTVLTTPNIDYLAKNGAYFKNAYVTTSICAVSRASILSGQYARRHGIWGFSKNFTEEQLKNTYPLQLKKGGYAIGFIGKYGVGNQQPEEEFDYWEGFPGQGSFKAEDATGNPIHLTQKIGQQAMEFLDVYTKKESPFSLSISFKAPHVEGDPGSFLPDTQFLDLYENDSIPIPVNSNKKYFDHFPSEFTENNVARNRWEDRFVTPEMQQENIKKYYRLIKGVDRVIGQIIEKLRETGQDKNTVIIFSSDNGFYLGEYGFAGKWYGSEPSIRVPTIIYDPRYNAMSGKIIEEKVLNIDLAPTILSYAGITPPASMQGKDLSVLLQKKSPNWRNKFFYEHLWQSSDNYYIPSTEGIVSGNKKYMKYFMNQDTTAIIFEELYDLEKDPLEQQNLIGHKDSAKLEETLKSEYLTIKKSAE